MTRPNGPGQSGVLHHAPSEGRFHHARLLPALELRPFIDCYWMVHWDLRGKPRYLAETLPHPCVFWVTELGKSAIHGVGTRRFTRWLDGKGRVCGVRFRPGGFYPFLRTPISAITDRSLALRGAFGAEGLAIGKLLRGLDVRAATAPDPTPGSPSPDDLADEEMMDLMDHFLLARLPAPDARLGSVTAIIAAIRNSTEITRVGQVAERFHLSPRALQRLFGQYVGVSPKSVIQRYRMHEALGRVDAGRSVDWARLAVELGYFDQTHFIKDFKALTGRSPGEYEMGHGRQG